MPEPDGTAPLVCVRWVTALSGMNCAAMGLEVGFEIMEAASKFCPTWYFPSSWKKKKSLKCVSVLICSDILLFLWYSVEKDHAEPQEHAGVSDVTSLLFHSQLHLLQEPCRVHLFLNTSHSKVFEGLCMKDVEKNRRFRSFLQPEILAKCAAMLCISGLH